MTPQLNWLIRKNSGSITKQKDLTCHLIGLNTKVFKLRFINLFVHKNQKHISKILNSSNNLNRNKPFWQYIKSCKKDQAGISSLQTPDGVATTPLEKAEVLNNTFKSVFTSHNSSPLPTLPISTYPSLPEINITEHGVFSLLSQIDLYKACGPDNIPARVLKELALELTPMITHLFKQSLATSELPPEWKSAYITPVFKKDKEYNPSNYRPVSSTSILCKTFEHILVSQTIKHLETNQILRPNRFRFRMKHSCESQLLLTIHDFSYFMN